MERYDLARRLILEAGASLRGIEQMNVEQKLSHQDLVPKYDEETEHFLRTGILTFFPGDTIVGEELPDAKGSCTVWYIDPIDGTTNFINQRRNFAISVACYLDGHPSFGLVLDVAANTLYHAQTGGGAFRNEVRLPIMPRHTELAKAPLTTPCIQHTFLQESAYQDAMRRLAEDIRAVRSLGSVALELCSLAAGEVDVFVAIHSSPWDHNAARIILSETGGVIGSLTGGELPIAQACPVLACASPELLALVRSQYLN